MSAPPITAYKATHLIVTGITFLIDKSSLNLEPIFKWTVEVIVGLVAAGIFLIALVVVSIMCKLRSNEKRKTEKYKARERIEGSDKDYN